MWREPRASEPSAETRETESGLFQRIASESQLPSTVLPTLHGCPLTKHKSEANTLQQPPPSHPTKILVFYY